MVKEMIDGTYRQTNLQNESAEYLAKREEVRLARLNYCEDVNAWPSCGALCLKALRARNTSVWTAVSTPSLTVGQLPSRSATAVFRLAVRRL